MDAAIREGGQAVMDTRTRENLTKLRDYVSALLDADAVMSEAVPESPEPVDLAAWKTSQRNRVLAGSGRKAELLGTLSTEPSIRDADLDALGIDAEAAAVIKAERDRIRQAALALTVAPAAPKEIER